MLSEEEKQYWIKRHLEVITEEDEDLFMAEADALPPEKDKEVSEFLFRLWIPEKSSEGKEKSS
jgi:hypothetical protein